MPSRNPIDDASSEDAGAIAPGGTVRFNVSGGQLRSAVWRVWTKDNTNDVYAAAREIAGHIKISLHESGSWQHGFVSDEKAEGFRLPGQSRHFTIWQRPPELLPGWTRAVQIMIPDASLQARPSLSTQKKPVADLLAGPDGDTTIAEIWLESAGTATPPPLNGSQLVGRLRQPNGGTVWVAAHRLALPWDPYQRFDQYIRTAHAEAIRQHPDWTGDPPLSICLFDQDHPNPELILRELAVAALIRRIECVACYAGSGPARGHGSMAAVEWEDVIGQAALLGARRAVFIGGEPTLHPGLARLVRTALGYGMTAEVFTNLVRVTPALWELFAEPGVSVATSWYSSDRDKHAMVTGRDTWRQTRSNIAEMIRRGIPLRIGLIDGIVPGQQAGKAERDLRALGVTDISQDRVRQFGRGTIADPSQACGHCGRGVAAVLPDGSVTPCPMTRWLAVGNVREAPLGAILEDEMAAAVAELPVRGPDGRDDRDRGCKPTCMPDSWCDPLCSPGACKPRI